MNITIATIGVSVILLLSVGWGFIFCERGCITGEFVKGTTEGFGEFCGQYPHTSLRLVNYSIEGNWDHMEGWFYFGNEIDFLDDLVPGDTYRFWWHQESRPSDTTSGDQIYYYVLNGYEEVVD